MYDYLIKGVTIVDGLGGKPYAGDVAIQDGKIAAVGASEGSAKETIDAGGAYVTPGWVDVHTHYDGQVSWDDTIEPSFSHGVTSIVMGNCGVGFAPCPPGGEQRMIELMEGVEDIPGTALYEGIEWGRWETFPEYVDYLGGKQYTMDVGTQIPHSAVRNYVMGERALEDATADDLEAMCRIVTEGLQAGAVGFSTSRTVAHRSVLGEPIPGTYAEKAELLAIGHAIKAAGRGIFQGVPAGVVGDLVPEEWATEADVELFAEIARTCGLKATFTLAQNGSRPDQWRNCLGIVEEANRQGALLTPQIATRPIGFVTSLKSYHMFMRRETYLKIAGLPFSQMLAEMKKPEVKAAILADSDVPPDQPGVMANVYGFMAMAAPVMFPIEMPINYEPEPDRSMGALAEAAGKDIAD